MDDQVRAAQQQIDAAIEGKTVLDFFERNAADYPDRPALRARAGEDWRTITWREYRDLAVRAGAGLRALGVEHGDYVAIMGRNVPEHVIADAATLHAAGTPVSVYNTLAPDQVAYIAANCGAKIAILENRDFMKRWLEIRDQLPSLTHFVLIDDADEFRTDKGVLSWAELLAKGDEALAADPSLVTRAIAEVTPDDPATLVYTSGTTGPPKGTVITHRNARWTMESVFSHLPLPMHLRVVSYLPLAHVAERAVTYYAGLHRANETYFCPVLTEAVEMAKEVRPDIFLGVPRVWEKAKAGILTALDAEHSPVRKALARATIDLGTRAVRLQQAGRSVPPWIGIPRGILDSVVASKIRGKLGFDRAKVLLTGSAPCPDDVMEFFHAIGLPILDTWGMTELTVVASINPLDRPRIGTVGVPLPGVEIRIAEDGEILARGGLVTAGYLNRPEATAETFDTEGWVHSGDLGTLDPDGHLRIVGRKKELIITAGGKNISPNNIEALVKEHPLVGQVCVIGDARPYLTALIALDEETAPSWADSNGVAFTDLASFAADPRVRDEIARAVESANQRLAKVETIKRYEILPAAWSPDSGELTPTLKLKRSVIAEMYADVIESLYAAPRQ